MSHESRRSVSPPRTSPRGRAEGEAARNGDEPAKAREPVAHRPPAARLHRPAARPARARASEASGQRRMRPRHGERGASLTSGRRARPRSQAVATRRQQLTDQLLATFADDAGANMLNGRLPLEQISYLMSIVLPRREDHQHAPRRARRRDYRRRRKTQSSVVCCMSNEFPVVRAETVPPESGETVHCLTREVATWKVGESESKM